VKQSAERVDRRFRSIRQLALGGAVRWGVVGPANIARTQFLPGLREAGSGVAVRVASRDRARAEAFARDYGVSEGVAGYERVVEASDIDAVYIALPNAYHAVWTQRALRAGKVVLCEKPMCVGSAQTAEVLETAASERALLWEAFVFPFQAQHRRLLDLIAGGAVGEVRELVSAFHFRLSRSEDIRLVAGLGGGALADVGCYPLRLAQELLSTPDVHVGSVVGFATGNGEVETEAVVAVDYGRQRLVLTCGFERSYDTFTRVLGTEGHIHLTNPFHPGPNDTLVVRPGRGQEIVERPTSDVHSFTAALRHIHSVIREGQEPEHLAHESSLRTAKALDAVVAACAQ